VRTDARKARFIGSFLTDEKQTLHAKGRVLAIFIRFRLSNKSDFITHESNRSNQRQDASSGIKAAMKLSILDKSPIGESQRQKDGGCDKDDMKIFKGHG